MSQRNSEYTRVNFDEYNTPEEVIELLAPHIPRRIVKIFDPCCGKGNVVKVFNSLPFDAYGKDLQRDGYDYLKDTSWHEAIVTNPPYGLAEEFAAHAINHSTFVALLLRSDWHFAKRRKYLFRDCQEFSKIIAIQDRIVFIERIDGKRAAPSEYHAWYIWDAAREQSAPTVTWAP